MKHLKNYTLAVTLLLIMAGISSCKKDNSSNASCPGGTFSATIDGVAFSGSSYNNTVIRGNSNGTVAKRLDIRATAGDGKVIILTVTNIQGATQGKCIRTATYYNDATQNYTDGTNYEGMVGTYMTNATTVAGETLPLPGESGSVVITSCDETNQKISGNFSFTTNAQTGGGAYTIAGTFSNMCYTFAE